MKVSSYQILRKAWDVRGYTFEGSIYCLKCCLNELNDYGDRPVPIFASDDIECQCDQCGKVID